MVPRRSPADEVPFPALLRSARNAYGAAIRRALSEAGFVDMPRSGPYVIGAISRSSAQLAEIIEGLGVTKQAAGQLVDTLVLRGYIDRSVDSEDRRRLTVALTARGRAAAAITRATVERLDAELLKRVGAERLAHARATLFALHELSRSSEPNA